MYYKTEGQADAVRIELPVESYVPVFGHRATPLPMPLSGQRAPHPAASALRVLALPFESRSPTRRDERLCDSLTDELSHQLSRIPNVKIVARSSAFQYKGRPADIPDLVERRRVRPGVPPATQLRPSRKWNGPSR
jgi:adenylate cyclase